MTAIGSQISIISLNVNGLNSPLNKHRLSGDTQKIGKCLLPAKCSHLIHWQRQTQTESKRMEINIPNKRSQEAKRNSYALQIWQGRNQAKTNQKRQESHYTLINGTTVQPEGNVAVKLHAPSA